MFNRYSFHFNNKIYFWRVASLKAASCLPKETTCLHTTSVAARHVTIAQYCICSHIERKLSICTMQCKFSLYLVWYTSSRCGISQTILGCLGEMLCLLHNLYIIVILYWYDSLFQEWIKYVRLICSNCYCHLNIALPWRLEVLHYNVYCPSYP